MGVEGVPWVGARRRPPVGGVGGVGEGGAACRKRACTNDYRDDADLLKFSVCPFVEAWLSKYSAGNRIFEEDGDMAYPVGDRAERPRIRDGRPWRRLVAALVWKPRRSGRRGISSPSVFYKVCVLINGIFKKLKKVASNFP